MTRHRFFHPDAGGEVYIDREDAAYHYFVRVARVRPGEDIVLFRGDGVDFVYRLEEADSRGLKLLLAGKAEVGADPSLPLTLLLAVLKGDRVSEVIRGVVPLGAGHVIPFLAARGVPHPKQDCEARWTTVADEAVRQCGRTRSTVIHRTCDSFGEALGALRKVAKGAMAGLVFWEASERGLEDGLKQVAGKVRSGEASEVVYAIGPEGGFEPTEVREAARAGLLPCRLGPRVLRSELAAVVAASLMQHRLGDLR